MDLKDLLESLKQRIEKGEDASEVFDGNKHLFKKTNTDSKDVWKDSGKDEQYEVDIRIYRKPGMGNSVQMVSGSSISIMTATTSLIQTLINNEIWPNKQAFIKDMNNMLKDKEN